MKRTLNTTINRSKNEKNDEHYTKLADIENEVRSHKEMKMLCVTTIVCLMSAVEAVPADAAKCAAGDWDVNLAEFPRLAGETDDSPRLCLPKYARLARQRRLRRRELTGNCDASKQGLRRCR